MERARTAETPSGPRMVSPPDTFLAACACSDGSEHILLCGRSRVIAGTPTTLVSQPYCCSSGVIFVVVEPVWSSWPVCGKCCEVAPFAWFGEPHRCLFDSDSDDGDIDAVADGEERAFLLRRHDAFHVCLTRALSCGEHSEGRQWGLDEETLAAINVVADQFPNPAIASVGSAHDEFARDVTDVHFYESKAALRACYAGVIPPREAPHSPPPPGQYGPGSITVTVPEPVAARAWILANRAQPTELYRQYVLHRDCHRGHCD